MNGQIPESFIDHLLDRIDLVELVGNRIALKKSGSRYSACCPFHQEKTPSFSLKRGDRQYHCFGCGAHGDAISFLREFENRGFVEAVEELAKIAGVEVPRDPIEREQAVKRRTQLDAIEFAANYYEVQLTDLSHGEVARQYLSKRGLSSETVAKFRLGFAPPFSDSLSRTAPPDVASLLEQTRLIGNSDGRRYDLFRNRVMFPIRNTRGQVVAFGGRTLGDDKAKYINSPESEIFHKSHEVYGLHEALRSQRSIERLLIVEGYMDVVSLHQAGITFAVAMLGTATNNDNLRAALKACPHLTFCFDGDTAGRRAAEKAMQNMLELLTDGVTAEFLFLPDGEDPDSLIQKEGEDTFRKRITQATPLSRFLLDHCTEGLKLNIAEQQGVFRARLDPLLTKIPSRTIKQGLNDAAYTRIREARFRPSGRPLTNTGSNGAHATPAMPVPSLLGARDKALIKGLYFDPTLASQVLELANGPTPIDGARLLADYLVTQNIDTTAALLRSLARDFAARDVFHHYLDKTDLILPREASLAEAHDTLKTLRSIPNRRG